MMANGGSAVPRLGAGTKTLGVVDVIVVTNQGEDMCDIWMSTRCVRVCGSGRRGELMADYNFSSTKSLLNLTSHPQAKVYYYADATAMRRF